MENPNGINVLGLSYTPAETIEVVSRAGAHRGMMRPDKIFLAGVYGGILLSFGAAASLILNAEPWYAENAPGFPRLVGALIFPGGLALIVLTGAELFTAGNMYTGVAFYHGRLPLWRMLLHWTLCWLGNLAGSLFSMAILFEC
jgi:formate/nitrite transporter FocA (FNT family)